MATIGIESDDDECQDASSMTVPEGMTHAAYADKLMEPTIKAAEELTADLVDMSEIEVPAFPTPGALSSSELFRLMLGKDATLEESKDDGAGSYVQLDENGKPLRAIVGDLIKERTDLRPVRLPLPRAGMFLLAAYRLLMNHVAPSMSIMLLDLGILPCTVPVPPLFFKLFVGDPNNEAHVTSIYAGLNEVEVESLYRMLCKWMRNPPAPRALRAKIEKSRAEAAERRKAASERKAARDKAATESTEDDEPDAFEEPYPEPPADREYAFTLRDLFCLFLIVYTFAGDDESREFFYEVWNNRVHMAKLRNQVEEDQKEPLDPEDKSIKTRRLRSKREARKSECEDYQDLLNTRLYGPISSAQIKMRSLLVATQTQILCPMFASNMDQVDALIFPKFFPKERTERDEYCERVFKHLERWWFFFYHYNVTAFHAFELRIYLQFGIPVTREEQPQFEEELVEWDPATFPATAQQFERDTRFLLSHHHVNLGKLSNEEGAELFEQTVHDQKAYHAYAAAIFNTKTRPAIHPDLAKMYNAFEDNADMERFRKWGRMATAEMSEMLAKQAADEAKVARERADKAVAELKKYEEGADVKDVIAQLTASKNEIVELLDVVFKTREAIKKLEDDLTAEPTNAQKIADTRLECTNAEKAANDALEKRKAIEATPIGKKVLRLNERATSLLADAVEAAKNAKEEQKSSDEAKHEIDNPKPLPAPKIKRVMGEKKEPEKQEPGAAEQPVAREDVKGKEKAADAPANEKAGDAEPKIPVDDGKRPIVVGGVRFWLASSLEALDRRSRFLLGNQGSYPTSLVISETYHLLRRIEYECENEQKAKEAAPGPTEPAPVDNQTQLADE